MIWLIWKRALGQKKKEKLKFLVMTQSSPYIMNRPLSPLGKKCKALHVYKTLKPWEENETNSTSARNLFGSEKQQRYGQIRTWNALFGFLQNDYKSISQTSPQKWSKVVENVNKLTTVLQETKSLNKNALTAVISLACLEIRSRNEEAINSTRNRIYSLKVFYFLLYRRRVFFRIFTFYLFLNWFSTRVSNDRKYVSGRRLYAYINTRKFKGLDSTEISSLPEIKKVIYMAPQAAQT